VFLSLPQLNPMDNSTLNNFHLAPITITITRVIVSTDEIMHQTKSEEMTPTVSDMLSDALVDAKVEELRRSIEALYVRIDELVRLKSKTS